MNWRLPPESGNVGTEGADGSDRAGLPLVHVLPGRPTGAGDLDRGRVRNRGWLDLAAERELLPVLQLRLGADLGNRLGVHDHDLSGLEVAVEDLLREHVFDVTLDRATQRPGSKHRVVALGSQQRLRCRCELETHVLVLQLRVNAASMRSTIWMVSSSVNWWKTMMSSMRLRNSGRKCCFSSSLTFAFIRS